MAAKFTEASTTELVICKPIVWIGEKKKQKCRKHKLSLLNWSQFAKDSCKSKPHVSLCCNPKELRVWLFPIYFCNITRPQRVQRQASWRKAGSPCCTLESQALRMLRKANKHGNQEKEPEAINGSMDQITEFISNYVRIWTVGWGHGGESKELEQETGGIKDGR